MAGPLKLPDNVLTTTRIAASLGLIQAALWVSLFAVALSSYLEGCTPGLKDTISPVHFFGVILHQFYFISEDCEYSNIEPEVRALSPVTSNQIFIWSAIGVSFCSIWLIASIFLLFYVTDQTIKTVNLVIYTWCITVLAVTVVDLTLGILFGISYESITAAMIIPDKTPDPDVNNFMENVFGEGVFKFYFYDMIRLASLLLMSISLRGFVMIIVNVTLVVILFLHSVTINKMILQSQQHSIHTREPIHAFSSHKQGPNSINMWQNHESEYEQPMERISTNYARAFRPENEERSTWRSNMERDNGPRQSDRTNSWQQREHSNMAARPFSYLEEPRPVRQPNAVPSPTVPSVISPPWKRSSNWEPAPPVPAPDYSPINTRKLKSALKTGYNY